MTPTRKAVLSALSDHHAMTGMEIAKAASIQPDRGLARCLTSLYQTGLIGCVSLAPLRYEITDDGRDVLARHR